MADKDEIQKEIAEEMYSKESDDCKYCCSKAMPTKHYNKDSGYSYETYNSRFIHNTGFCADHLKIFNDRVREEMRYQESNSSMDEILEVCQDTKREIENLVKAMKSFVTFCKEKDECDKNTDSDNKDESKSGGKDVSKSDSKKNKGKDKKSK